MVDIKFYEVFKEEKECLQEYLPKDISVVFTENTIQEEEDASLPAKLICIRTQSIIPDEWGERLEGILTRSQGFDHVLEYTKRTDTKAICGYLGDYCSIAVAEHAITLMLMLVKKIKQQMRQFNNFSRSGLMADELAGKKALVIGVGNIGKEIVQRVQNLGMAVKGVDIEDKMESLEYVALEEGISWAEVIFCALPLTDQTKQLLNYEILKKESQPLYLINISRGEISPLNEMNKLMLEGCLGGLAMDVFDNESHLSCVLRQGAKDDENVKLIQTMTKQDNVIFTPHNAFNTMQATKRKAKLTAEAVTKFLSKKIFPNQISI